MPSFAGKNDGHTVGPRSGVVRLRNAENVLLPSNVIIDSVEPSPVREASGLALPPRNVNATFVPSGEKAG